MSKEMHFKNSDALATVVQVINEANSALCDVARTIQTSSIPEILGGVAGATGGAAVSFAALYSLWVQYPDPWVGFENLLKYAILQA